MILGEIENRLRSVNDEWVQKWVNGEASILDTFIKPNEPLIRSVKSMALQTIENISVQDLQKSCNNAKPHLNEIWFSDKAVSRFTTELSDTKNYITKI